MIETSSNIFVNANSSAALLRHQGFTDILLNLGEVRASGRNDGQPWQVGIEDPLQSARHLAVLPLQDRAVATTAPRGRRDFVIDVERGERAERYHSLSVLAPTASLADGLSTAFSTMAWPAVVAAARQFDDIAVLARQRDQKLRRLGRL